MTFYAQLGRLTDELIEVISATTSQTDPARFDALRESSLRKLRQHSFLRTNQFEVYRALDGYEERFRVLNREGAADALKARLDALAQCSNQSTPDVLDLLLRLADQPVQKSNLGDLELLKGPDANPEPSLKWSDIAKEDGWDEDGELWRQADLGGSSSDDDYADYETNASVRSDNTSLSSVEARYLNQPADYLDTLPDGLDLNTIRQSQAWRRRSSAENGTYRSQTNTISEIETIREILFMLGGLETDLFDCHGKPSLGIHLAHASWQIFRSLLVSASDAGRRLSLLRQYVEQQQDIPLLQVFQAAIESRLRSFDNTIASMQAHYADITQDLVVSVVKLMNDLGPHLHPLNLLATTIEQLEQSETSQPFHYLELLYLSAQGLQLVGDDVGYRFTSELFFECFSVYLEPIRRWMQSGELLDSDKVFFISRSSVDVPLSQVWADQFYLKRTPEGSLFAPWFLEPATSTIFTTGKSIVILKLLGKHWPTQEAPEPATKIDMSAIPGLVPFSEVFGNMFNQWMQGKHQAASVTLKQTLFQTYNFRSDLDMLQLIYLMSDGSRSNRFAGAVFSNIDIYNAHWDDRFNLTEIAREAFDGLIDPHRLNVTAPQNKSRSDVKDVRRTVRAGLPLIRIAYRLPWLSRIVLTDECLEHYRLIFTFLLQLRRATYVLTKHRILSDGLGYMTTEQETFYSLRSKLLWFCNTLQSYLSTLVLGPLATDLVEEMRKAEDIDRMITSHFKFTKQMIDEACLGGKLDPIRQAILDVFDLAIRLQDARRIELQRVARRIQGNSRLSVTSSPDRDDPDRYDEVSEEEESNFLGDQDKRAMMQDEGIPYSLVLAEIRSALDRHLKFICGGLRGVARARSSEAANKWDILAEMLEVGIRGLR
ncbi:Spc98 family-domain-containing protein [Xylaria palmicola]|nr:Spc98 family-domain-containing protein [Xylaria palmicola]